MAELSDYENCLGCGKSVLVGDFRTVQDRLKDAIGELRLAAKLMEDTQVERVCSSCWRAAVEKLSLEDVLDLATGLAADLTDVSLSLSDKEDEFDELEREHRRCPDDDAIEKRVEEGKEELRKEIKRAME